MGKDKMITKEINVNSSGSESHGKSNYSLRRGREDTYIDNADAQSSKRTCYIRHTPHQIRQMEAEFKVCPQPSDEQRRELGRENGFEPSQVMLWFQNRRHELKTQFEYQETIQLRARNERLRIENKRYREALCAAVACAACGRPVCVDELSHEEYRLKMENARLRAEIGLMSRVAAMYNGKPFPPP